MPLKRGGQGWWIKRLAITLLVQSTRGFTPAPTCLSPWRQKLALQARLSLNDDWTQLANKITGAVPKATEFQTNPVPPVSQASSRALPDLSSWFHLPATTNMNVGGVFASTFNQAVSTVESTTTASLALFLALPLYGQIGVALVPISMMLLGVFYNMALSAPDDFRQGMEPYLRGNYDPIQAKAYYSRHNLLVFQRASQVFRLSNGFLRNLLWDKYVLRDEERNRAKRAEELLELVTKLGPTAIKIGQALSVRPDLIPEEYATALATLQDQVPPFDGKAAKEILRRELGPERFSHLKEFPFMKNGDPVASASIGQGRF